MHATINNVYRLKITQCEFVIIYIPFIDIVLKIYLITYFFKVECHSFKKDDKDFRLCCNIVFPEHYVKYMTFRIRYRAVAINLIYVIKSVALATVYTIIYFDFMRFRLNNGNQHSVSMIANLHLTLWLSAYCWDAICTPSPDRPPLVFGEVPRCCRRIISRRISTSSAPSHRHRRRHSVDQLVHYIDRPICFWSTHSDWSRLNRPASTVLSDQL